MSRGRLRWIEPTEGAVRGEVAPQREHGTDPPPHLPEPQLSDNALAVLRRRYLLRDGKGQLDETPRQLFWRVASFVARAEAKLEGGSEGQARTWAERFYRAMAARRFVPNSPTLHNAGTQHPMCSACFVLPIQDSIESIYATLRAAALVHKSGGGTGFDFSKLRPRGDRVGPTGGTTDGPVRFLRAYSQATAAIRQGAFRQGANMGILRIDHPDILEFLAVKGDLRELTNFNLSVAVDDGFLDRLERTPNAPHEVVHPRTAERKRLERPDGGPWTVAELWAELARRAHESGEPGLFFVDRVNADDPVPHLGRIAATNPCGEQPLHAWDSCNLGSINLATFVRGRAEQVDFDWQAFSETVRLAVRFLDDVIEVNELPLPELTAMNAKTRRIGLGVMGFADALFQLALPYDSEEGCAFGEQVQRVLAEESFEASRELAAERGSFEAWPGSRFERDGVPMRNAFRTTVAPTGTISILAGCSGGIEPVYSLVYLRQVMADEHGEPTILREVNPVFEALARSRGFWSDALAKRILEQGSIQDCHDVPALVREVFVTARDIAPRWHLAMQAAFQTHCDSGISKTINFPREATVEDVLELFDAAVQHDVRGLTCYRDGSRDRQPMALLGSQRGANLGQATGPAPIDLPEILPSLSVRQTTPQGLLHAKISVDPRTGAELDVFAHVEAKHESRDADLEATCRMLGLWLRSGGSLDLALAELERGADDERRTPSLVAGLVGALRRYLAAKRRHGLEALLLGKVPPHAWEEAPAALPARGARSAPRRAACPSCGDQLVYQEGCATCHSCGFGEC
jgi:ribonucleoside-diphosphate reductase alpha chain